MDKDNININYLMNMTKKFLDGEISDVSYILDFPYELEKRYAKMVKEDRNYAEMIYDYLIEDGINVGDKLPESKFKELIEKQYRYIKDLDKGDLL